MMAGVSAGLAVGLGRGVAVSAEVGGDLAAILAAATVEEAWGIIAGAVQRVTIYREGDPAITWQPWAAAPLEGTALGTAG
jgi:hypothetical protein